MLTFDLDALSESVLFHDVKLCLKLALCYALPFESKTSAEFNNNFVK